MLTSLKNDDDKQECGETKADDYENFFHPDYITEGRISTNLIKVCRK